MDAMARIEQSLEAAVAQAAAAPCPPRLGAALQYAVFPGGARIRPRLTLSVAWACGDDLPAVTDGAAAAIEFLHCASLVHDDLPCFDDAPIRRGKPAVHVAFGQPLALLVGDALIVLAFETLARVAARRPERLAALIGVVGGGVGSPRGITAGQAWECEAEVDVAAYHRAKTGALFAAATMAGAAAAGHAPEPWRLLGERLGEAYQVADDLRDVAATVEEIGKPGGRDAALGRPSAVRELGLAGAIARLDQLIDGAVGSIPPCPGEAVLKQLITQETRRFLPKELAREVA